MTDRPKKEQRRQSLHEQGLANSAANAVRDEHFRNNDFFEPEDLVQARYEMLRCVRTGKKTASAAATLFGVSRATYYQAQAAFEQAGIAGLIPHKRGPRSAHKLTNDVLEFILERMRNKADLSSAAAAQLVKERFHLVVHPRSIERAIERRKKKR